MKSTDPDFRPATLFWPLDLKTHLLATIKGAERREMVENSLDAGVLDELPAEILSPALSDEDRNDLGRLHPAFMGGEYLPDREEEEVEIARVTLDSTLQDVVCIYARRIPEGIAYRVVDEYDSSTLTGDHELTVSGPLTLGQLTDFLLEAWDLIWVLDTAFDGEEDDVYRDFFSGSSPFYPGFGNHLAARVDVWLESRHRDDDNLAS